MKAKERMGRASGFAAVDLLIVAVIILIVLTYALTTVSQAQRWQARVGAAQQFANYLETARGDSMRRRAIQTPQMADVTILSDSFYTVRVDANGDGVLDAPRVVSLADQHLTISGLYPTTLMFDSAGKALDVKGNPISATVITFGNRSGKSVVTVSEAGKAKLLQE